MSLNERIAEAQKTLNGLKQQIESSLASKMRGSIKLSDRSDEEKYACNFEDRRTLRGHFGKVYSVHWAGDSRQVVSASQDGKLIVWDAHTTNKVQAIPLASAWIMTCAFEQKNNRVVACGGLDNLCTIYDINQCEEVVRPSQELASHDGYLSCCRFIGDTDIVTSSGDSTCILWDVERGDSKVIFNEHGGDVMSVAICPTNNNIFVSGSCDATAKVWDTRTGRSTHSFSGHESDINSVNFFPDGMAFGTGSDDSSCRLFDLRSYSQLNEFSDESIFNGVTSIDFSKSGRLLFAGYDDHVCHVWDTIGRESMVCSLSTHEQRVSCLGVNPDGTALCTGSWDTFLKVWA
eukprot:TRINITY_DN8674_c0_g1_i1.p1 TRINITY_DN8674_c0_g1~~TRINITY_DN8674_c0_g1_i1.p1  ORF type:complete len:347 (+),score=95.33 TRINITY_DN8674_c0_g1_i1:63-1103(+)